jgi:L-ascorbate metabolism protein UlaG (beta-lactamase superfamily)
MNEDVHFTNGDRLNMKSFKSIALVLLIGLVMLGMSYSLSGAVAPGQKATEEPIEAVILHYLGRSSFFFTAPDGTRVVIDPFVGAAYPFPEGIEADVVTVSHTFHSDHNNVNAVEGNPIVIDELQEEPEQFGMVEISSYLVTHPGGGDNLVFVYQIEDVKLVHLGDTDPIRDPEVLDAIKDADVILAPEWVIVPMMARTDMRTVIPMHYSFENVPDNQTPLDDFLATLPSDITVIEDVAELEITPEMPIQIVTMLRWPAGHGDRECKTIRSTSSRAANRKVEPGAAASERSAG